jgi:geranylgeranyl pyrophosphate synthase
LTVAEAVATRVDEPMRVAAASVELVHCYSLIHDDLPAMDDDDLRRGRPTSHKAFGEATAILAGDALLTLAFEWLADAAKQANAPGRYLPAIAALAHGAGVSGMVRGQARDTMSKPPATLEAIERLHLEKTGALFRAAVEIGGAVAGGNPAQIAALARFGACYGIAFQHADDRDDDEHTEFAAAASKRIHERVAEALAALQEFGARAAPLCALALKLDASATARE